MELLSLIGWLNSSSVTYRQTQMGGYLVVILSQIRDNLDIDQSIHQYDLTA